MLTIKQLRTRAKYLFRKKIVVDPLQPVYSIEKQTIKWSCKLCVTEQVSQINPESLEDGYKCKMCGKKHFINDQGISIRRFLFSSKEEVIYITNATARELKAKLDGDLSIAIRPKLTYHTKYECELAHRNYEYDGVLIAMNSGVIKSTPHDYLIQCDECAGVNYLPCPRCNGKGYIARYRHIEKGICFRCWGASVEKVLKVDLVLEHN